MLDAFTFLEQQRFAILGRDETLQRFLMDLASLAIVLLVVRVLNSDALTLFATC